MNKIDLLESGLRPTNGRPLLEGNRPLSITIFDSGKDNVTIYDVDSWHRNTGLTMIGFHFYVSKEGNIYVARPEKCFGEIIEDTKGRDFNTNNILICVEGDFEVSRISSVQKSTVVNLLQYLLEKYTNIDRIYSFNELIEGANNPGLFLPINEIRSKALGSLDPLYVTAPNGIITYSYGSRTLYYNDDDNLKGNDIRILQENLNSLGYVIEFRNGVYDIYTLNAINSFQRFINVEINGIVDEYLYDIIDKLIKIKYKEKNVLEFYRILYFKQPVMFGEDIFSIRNRLTELGYDLKSVSNEYDQDLEDVVKLFQANKGIYVDGIIGPITFSIIESSSVTSFTRVLKLTSPLLEGEDVTAVQTKLRELGFFNDKINGKYGVSTKIAVANLQASKFIMVTGEVDLITYNIIFNKN